MKLKSYLWSMLTVLAFAMAASGCSDDDDAVVPEPPVPGPDTQDPTLVLKSASVEAPAEGGEFSFQFTVANPTDARVEAAAAESWIKNVKVTESRTSFDGKVSFSVEANEMTEAREAKIKVSYKGAKDAEFTVKQAAKQEQPTPEELSIKLEVKDITAHGAKFVITPSDNAKTYVADVLPAEEFNRMGEEGLLAELGNLVTDDDLLLGAMEIVDYADDLMPETDYVLFAVGFEQGKASSKLFKEAFKTLAENTPEPAGPEANGLVTELDSEHFAQWIYDYTKDANKEHFLGNRPAVIDFYGPGCGEHLVPIFDQMAKEFKGQINFFRFDFRLNEAHREVKQYMGVVMCPTIAFLQRGAAPVMYGEELSNNILDAEAMRAAIKKELGLEPENTNPEPDQPATLDVNMKATAGVGSITYTITCTSKNAESASFGVFKKEMIDNLIGMQMGLEQIVDGMASGMDALTAEEIKAMNSADGLIKTLENMEINMAYTALLDVRMGASRAVKNANCTVKGNEYIEIPEPQGNFVKRDGVLNDMNEDSFRYYAWDYINNPVAAPLKQKINFRGDRPVVVDYGAIEWCGNCQRLHPIMEEIARKYAGRVDVFYMNSDRNPFLKSLIEISGVPRIYLFSNEGDMIEERGVPSVDELSQIIEDKLLWADKPQVAGPEIALDIWAGDVNKENVESRTTGLVKCLSKDAVAVKTGCFAKQDVDSMFPELNDIAIYEIAIKYGNSVDAMRMGEVNSDKGYPATYHIKPSEKPIFFVMVENAKAGRTVMCKAL